ncbi:MAG TPA: hypothetical protein VMV26_10785 [Alphaproteobacteria bacterium]|jgi:hypothetical protein|nr:hypothetical protein [Alphaproteobacteria bacterium]
MTTSHVPHPVRRRLPRNYSTEIGRVIARWALFESRLRALAYLLLDVSPERGRVAVRGGRVADYLTMLEDLMQLRGVAVTVKTKALKRPLTEVETFRDKLAHGVWLRHPRTRTPVLQVTKGDLAGPPAVRAAQAQPTAVTLGDLRRYVRTIDAAIRIADRLRAELMRQTRVAAPPRRRRPPQRARRRGRRARPQPKLPPPPSPAALRS